MDIMIVLNYNDFENTDQYLQQIKDYACLDKIVVVDNHSTDNSFEKLVGYRSDKIHVIKNEVNSGYAQGNNYGIHYCEASFDTISKIIISNPDIIVSETAIENILAGIDVEAGFAATSGLIYNWDHVISRVFAWRVPTYGTLLVDTFVLLGRACQKLGYSQFYDIPHLQRTGQFSEQAMTVEVLAGCFFCVDYKVFKEIGFFDEATFIYGEENIIAFKLKQKGYQARLLLQETVIHTQNNSIGQDITKSKTKNSHLLKTNRYFIETYLKKARWQVVLYQVLFKLGAIEKKIVLRLIKLIKRR